MPFEQKYTAETRDASLARVLERREAEPGNRSIIRETAEEFEVGEQSLRGWIRAHEKANAPDDAGEPETRPVEQAPTPAPAARTEPVDAPARRAAPRASSSSASSAASTTAAASDARVAELEAEVAKLRRDREALKNALAVLLSD